MVCIALIGILAGVGIPQYNSYKCKTKYNVSIQNFKKAVEYAKLSGLKCETSSTKPSFIVKRWHKSNIGKTSIISDGSSETASGCPLEDMQHLINYMNGWMMDELNNPWKNRRASDHDFWMISNYIAKSPDAWGDIYFKEDPPGCSKCTRSIKATLVPGSCDSDTTSDPYVIEKFTIY